MTDPLTMIETLRRPSLLVTAARIAQSDCVRTDSARRSADPSDTPRSSKAHALRLLDEENDLDQARRARCASYRPSRHVTVLSALLQEAQALRALQAEARGSVLDLHASSISLKRQAV